MKTLTLVLCLALFTLSLPAEEFHVKVNGNDKNNGSEAQPFRTISAAAQIAQPGDVITVHEGVYRERITPPRGGSSPSNRIVYRAAEGARVEIKGSEVITDWQRFKGDVWRVTLPNAFFRDYNPYQDVIAGDWFNNQGRQHHTGDVYLNGKSLYEMDTLEAVLQPEPISGNFDPKGSTYTWYCESDHENTTIYANFQGADPNQELVEINVRDSCFYPDKPGCDYITIHGFRLSQAATQWAPPTAEQIGLIGTHWSKGWIIENNVIHDSRCSGITLGKDRKTGQNVWSRNRVKDGATHYNEVIFRALHIGWSKETIGGHIIRNNTIFNCEQTGICGSLGGVFSQITNNHIYNIWTKRLFSGAEIAGIKIHASIDMLIKSNHIHNTGRGIWIDWMAQGTRITGNILYHNTTDDLFSEVNHGPYLVDNNVFLSDIVLRDWSEGGAFVHNLFAGRIWYRPEPNRFTPYHRAHSTEVAGVRNIAGSDNRFYNNIFVQRRTNHPTPSDKTLDFGPAVYDDAVFPLQSEGNVYLNGARPCREESHPLIKADFDPMIELEEKDDGIYLFLTLDESITSRANPLVTTKLLGKTKISESAFENPDGSPLTIDRDFYGRKRDSKNSCAGPFSNPGAGRLTLKVW